MIFPSFTVRARRSSTYVLVGAIWLSVISSTLCGEVRTWVDRTGKYRVEAEFVRVRDDKVTLRNSSGKEVTLPIARLSSPDQDFIRKQTAKSNGTSSGEQTGAQPKVKPATAKPVAKRFFATLVHEEFDDIKPMLTAEGQTNWDANKPLLEELDAPDDRKSILVRTAKGEADRVDVNVSVKVRGKWLKQQLQCRWVGDQWLITSLITDGEESNHLDFEKGTSVSIDDESDDP